MSDCEHKTIRHATLKRRDGIRDLWVSVKDCGRTRTRRAIDRGGRSKRWLKRVRFYAKMRQTRGRVTCYEEWIRLGEFMRYSVFRLSPDGDRIPLEEPRIVTLAEAGVWWPEVKS